VKINKDKQIARFKEFVPLRYLRLLGFSGDTK